MTHRVNLRLSWLMKPLENMSPLIFLLVLGIHCKQYVEEDQRRHRFFMTSQVRFVAALDDKKHVSFCIYLFGFYQLGKLVCLHQFVSST